MEVTMEVTFNNHFGTMPLETEIRSIFDRCCAGQIDINGNYYCIHTDHKTHEYYAMTVKNSHKAYELGRWLDDGEVAVFHGERVRAMTFEEERKYNEDRLLALVDLWGNIAVDEEFDMEWYMEHCF